METYDGPAWRLISTLCGESATRNLANRKARIGCHDEGVATCVALLLTLNFIVKASGEDFVLGSQSRSVDAYPAFSACQAFHLQFLRCDPCVFNRAAKHLTAMFGVLHAPCVPFWSIGGFMLLLGLRT